MHPELIPLDEVKNSTTKSPLRTEGDDNNEVPVLTQYQVDQNSEDLEKWVQVKNQFFDFLARKDFGIDSLKVIKGNLSRSLMP